VVHESDDSHYEWKRIQTSEQQAQRERKNIMQKALVFARRAKEIVTQERMLEFVMVPSSSYAQ
jgi:hypothetical protein